MSMHSKAQPGGNTQNRRIAITPQSACITLVLAAGGWRLAAADGAMHAADVIVCSAIILTNHQFFCLKSSVFSVPSAAVSAELHFPQANAGSGVQHASRCCDCRAWQASHML